MICRFACCKYSIKQGSIINIKGSNIAYVSPHIITIKENDYLIFNGSDKETHLQIDISISMCKRTSPFKS